MNDDLPLWDDGSEPTIVARHDPYHERIARADVFDRIRKMLVDAIRDEEPSDSMVLARHFIETGFLWIAEHHRRRL